MTFATVCGGASVARAVVWPDGQRSSCPQPLPWLRRAIGCPFSPRQGMWTTLGHGHRATGNRALLTNGAGNATLYSKQTPSTARGVATAKMGG